MKSLISFSIPFDPDAKKAIDKYLSNHHRSKSSEDENLLFIIKHAVGQDVRSQFPLWTERGVLPNGMTAQRRKSEIIVSIRGAYIAKIEQAVLGHDELSFWNDLEQSLPQGCSNFKKIIEFTEEEAVTLVLPTEIISTESEEISLFLATLLKFNIKNVQIITRDNGSGACPEIILKISQNYFFQGTINMLTQRIANHLQQFKDNVPAHY